MDTAPLKVFAVWARKDLIRGVAARVAAVLAPGSSERVEQVRAVAALESAVAASGGGEVGRGLVAERVAYTWFNRIIALRFMDANGYTGEGVVSPASGLGVGQPEVLAGAKRGAIDESFVGNSVKVAVSALLDGSRVSPDPQGEAYGLLLAEYCRYWNRAMPFMFEREGDFTELLMPSNLLAEGSILDQSVKVLTEDVCKDVEVIGWLYQFYISDRKDEVFAGFKKNKKAGPNEIPAATQLFTPHWIVRYLVENSLGRLWMLNRPTSGLVERMDYYIAPVDEETDFLKVNSPEELKIIDPACGSGHMLTYAFDLLYAIYEEEGYAPADIPELILTNNLFGTEIDQRAGALAAFALTMKARAKQRTFFAKGITPNVCVIEPISFSPDELEFLLTADGDHDAEKMFWNLFAEADLYGALIQPNPGFTVLANRHLETLVHGGDLLSTGTLERAHQVLLQASYLLPQYSVVVANPPFMGASRMSETMARWLKAELPLGKAGLDIAFWERSLALLFPGGRAGLITMQSWMFLATYVDFRLAILERWTLRGALHLGSGAFPEISGEVVGTVASVMSPSSDRDFRAAYLKLTESSQKEIDALHIAAGRDEQLRFDVSLDVMAAIPRAPIAYWMGEAERLAFSLRPAIATVCKSGNGLTSSDNDLFLRYWWEVSQSKVERQRLAGSPPSVRRWNPINKGGGFRRWAGNMDFVVDWLSDGEAILELRPASTVRNRDLYFHPSVSWSDVVTGPVSFRFYPSGWIFDASANSLFPTGDDVEGLLSFANSSFAGKMAPLLNPGLHFKLGDMGALPYLKRADPGWREEIRELVEIAQSDWDIVETGVGFAGHALLNGSAARECELSELAQDVLASGIATTRRVHELETRNNAQIATQFDLESAYAVESPVSEVSLNQNPWFGGRSLAEASEGRYIERTVVELVSYAVGCMFGRYSLNEPGLILADEGSTLQDYLAKVPAPTFTPDADNVIPIVDGDWFEDDIVARFREFIRVGFGEQNFEGNLRFITEALEVRNLRDYFVKSFYKDHVQRYKKRPIYWMFSSPKGSFNALIYMHRYTPSTVSTVLNEYLREFQAKLRASLENAERTNDAREADRLRKVLAELDEYEHDILYSLASQNIAIDLDDGVKVNYPKFGAALKKIPGLEAIE